MTQDELDRIAREAGTFYDLVTQGKGNAHQRDLAIALAVQWANKRNRRPEPKPRQWSQAALDSQPLRRAQKRARLKYERGVAEAKARAEAPLTGTKADYVIIDDPHAPRLL